MSENFCQQCRQINQQAPFALSCGHKICVDCASRYPLKDNFNCINEGEKFQIECMCGLGVIEIAYNEYLNFLNNCLSNQRQGKCKLHESPGKYFCEECQIWLCSSCLTAFHNKCYGAHHLLQTSPHISKCQLHPSKDNEMYCRKCTQEVCYQCIAKGERHYNHPIKKYDDYKNHIKDNIEKNKYKTFKQFDSSFKIIEGRLKRQFIDDFESRKKVIDDLIDMLRMVQEKYSKKMKEKFSSLGVILSIIRNLYKIYFNDVNQKEKSITVVRQISKVKKDVDEVLYINSFEVDNFNKVLKEIQDFYQTAPNCFSYKILFNKEEFNPPSASKARPQKIKDSLQLSSSLSKKKERPDKNPPIKNEMKKVFPTYAPQISLKQELQFKENVGEVLSLIQLKNGILVSSSSDSFIKFWDIETKKEVRRLSGHQKSVTCLKELSKNRLASGSDDEKIIIWNLKDYTQEFQLAGHKGEILSLGELTNKSLVSGSWDGTIKIWDLDNRKELASLEGHKGAVCSVCPLGNMTLASGSADQSIKLWDCRTYKEIGTLTGHSMAVFCIIPITDQKIASCSGDKSIKIWSLIGKQCLFSLDNTSSSWINCLCKYSEDWIVSGAKDQTFRFWDIEKRTLLYSSEKQAGFINSVIKLEDGRIGVGTVGEINILSVEK